MKRLAVLMMAFVAVVFLTGCPDKEPEYIDLGTIPEKYLATVPYEDGQTFYLQHESDRVVIPFHVTRRRVKAQGNNAYGFDYYLGKNKPSPTVFFDYELDITACKPDYSLFDIDIRFSNAYMADSVYYSGYDPLSPKCANLTIQNLNASFPFIGEPTDQYTVSDFLVVNGHIYDKVFQFDNESQNLQGIYVKTLFYNYEKGVIAVIMSNHEKYLLYEEE